MKTPPLTSLILVFSRKNSFYSRIGIISANTQLVVFQEREVIFRQDTPVSHVLFVKSGLVKIYKEGRNKRNFILKIASPGEYIGLMSVFGNSMKPVFCLSDWNSGNWLH